MIRFLALGLVLLCSCNQVLVAQLSANVPVEGTTSSVNVNFTTFEQPPGPGGNDGRLRAQFSDGSGNQMDFVLSSPGAGGFSATVYTVDNSTNVFTATLAVTAGAQSQLVPVTATSGTITVAAVVLSATGIVERLEGTFHVNFDGTHAGQGTFVVNQAAQ